LGAICVFPGFSGAALRPSGVDYLFRDRPTQWTDIGARNIIEGPDFSEAGPVATREISYYANDMPAVIQRTKDGNTVTTVLDYDGLGKRIKKSVLGGADTYYLGDYYEIENGTPVMYIYAGGLRVAKVAGATKHYYHKDHLQSSSVMTGANGLSVETTQYMPFGHTRTPPGAAISNYKFTDEERDPETGLYNYDARHYDPVIGRFVSADSLIQDFYDPQALNRYAYARNNPLKYIDPQGHVFWDIVDFASFGLSLYSFAAEPSLANAPFLAWDTAGLLPFVPSSLVTKAGYKGIKLLKEGGEKGAREAFEEGSQAGVQAVSKKRPGSPGHPDHQMKVKELQKKAQEELKPGEKIFLGKKVQGFETRRRPDVQILDDQGVKRKVFEAERHPNWQRNVNREAEYRHHGTDYETHPLD